MSLNVSIFGIEYAIKEVCRILEQKTGLAPRWETMPEKLLWRELVACILGSRVRFNVACAAMKRMDQAALFSKPFRSFGLADYEGSVMQALSGMCEPRDASRSSCRYPFFRMRAAQIRSAAATLYSNTGTIRSFLSAASDAKNARRRLSEKIAGLGPKQASLFLRNVGYATNVAVLDVHVLSYMNWIGLIPTPIKTVSTIRQYETIESRFIEHSFSSGFSPGHFDLAVWVVVRVAKREYATCQ